MSWRMTVVLPSEIEDAVRNEQHTRRIPISRLIKSMLIERYKMSEVDTEEDLKRKDTKNAS